MTQIIAVLGSTGAQGGSVVRKLLKDKTWHVRALTRNVNSDAAKSLKDEGAEMVAANLDDEKSLLKAFDGATAVFAITNFWEHMFTQSAVASRDLEAEQGIRVANAAAKTSTLKHYIWSSLPGVEKPTGGKFKVPHLDSKYIVDRHILEKLPDLAKKTTFLWVGWYGNNFVNFPLCKVPMLDTAGKHVWFQPCSGDSILPVAGDVNVNVGVFVAAILAKPEISLPAKTAFVQSEGIPCKQALEIWSEVTGKPSVYVEVSPETYDALWPSWGGEMAKQLKWGETVKNWGSLREGVLMGSDLGIEGQLVGLKGCLQNLKGL